MNLVTIERLQYLGQLMRINVNSYNDVYSLVKALEAHCWFETAGEVYEWFDNMRINITREFADDVTSTNP